MVLPIDQSVCLLCSGQSQLSLWGGGGGDPTSQSEPLPWEFPLILILTFDINTGHQTQIPTNPAFSSFYTDAHKKNSRSVFTARVSCSLSCVPSHTPTSSISSAQCCCSRNHPLDRLPACCSNDLEAFILDLWTCSHHSNSYNTHVRLYK